jgi:hypothetical protein
MEAAAKSLAASATSWIYPSIRDNVLPQRDAAVGWTFACKRIYKPCAKLARLSRLRGLYLPHWLKPIDVLLEFALQPIQLLIQLRGESTAPVGFTVSQAISRFFP